MTGMDDLVTWLRARLFARAEQSDDIHILGCGQLRYDGFCDCGEPARVLAEVDAKRRILDEHQIDCNGECETCRERGLERNQVWPCLTVRLLAQPYAGQPGYREEWRV